MGGHHDVEEYQGGSYVTHLIAGAVAGTAEHCGMFPVDTIKTHLQAKIPGVNNSGVSEITKKILTRSGISGLFRGLSAMAAGAGPAHAVHFAIYESCKYQFGGGEEGHHPFRVGAAGIIATLASEAVLSPTDAIKQRMQLHIVPYKGVVDCIKQVIQREGIRTLYSGYITTLTMNVPFQAIYFASYESLVKMLKKDKKDDGYSPFLHMIAGGGAGMVSAGLTNPFDVARTRLQTQGETVFITNTPHCHTFSTPNPLLNNTTTINNTNINNNINNINNNNIKTFEYKGMLHALTKIWKEEGVKGYTKGIKPRMVFHSMSAAILWSVYEYMKVIIEPHKEIKN